MIWHRGVWLRKPTCISGKSTLQIIGDSRIVIIYKEGPMKQKVAIRAIVRKDGKTLLLRRHGGRPSIDGKFEIPGGKLEVNEQPVDALKRTLTIHTGLAPETTQLFDVISYIDSDDRDLQYIFLVYLVSLPTGDNKVTLSREYDKYLWKVKSEIQQNDVTNSTITLLSLENEPIAEQEIHSTHIKNDDKSTTNKSMLIIYSDGGSRGNPGPSAAGFVIMNEHEDVLVEDGEYLGVMTNNLAEYHAVYMALQKAKSFGATDVDFRSDSLLIVNQMNGLFQVRNRELWPVHDRIKKLVKQFDSVKFTHVRREFNRLADGMVNKILDSKEKK